MGVVCSQLEYWTGASDAMAQATTRADETREHDARAPVHARLLAWSTLGFTQSNACARDCRA
eukprot:1347541-Pleurochrysis_carterae.AAC.1